MEECKESAARAKRERVAQRDGDRERERKKRREKEKERQRRRRFSGPLETTAEGSSRRRVCPHSFGVLLFFLATPPLNRGSLSPLFCSSVTMDDVGTLASACLRVAGRNRFQLEE